MQMQILKKPRIDFTQLPNALLRDKTLTLKAKGLYSVMFSKPDGWTFYEDTLVAESKDGRDGTRVAMDELLKAGWVTRTRARNPLTKRYEPYQYELHIFPQKAKPQPKTHSGNSAVGSGEPQGICRYGKAAPENPLYNNTVSSNTDLSKSLIDGLAGNGKRSTFTKSLGGVLRDSMVGGERHRPATAMYGKTLAETLEPFNGKIPGEWMPMAMLMYKLTLDEAEEAAGKFVFYYTKGLAADVRGEDVGMWAQRWGTWCRGVIDRRVK